MPEDLSKHLEFIQAVVARMARNSFLLKGWTVTIAVAVFALAAANDEGEIIAVLAVFPALSFWGLDAYYLRQERLFRHLYDDVRLASGEAAQKVEAFSLSTDKYRAEVKSWFKTLWTPAVLALHGIVVLVVVGVIVLLSGI